MKLTQAQKLTILRAQLLLSTNASRRAAKSLLTKELIKFQQFQNNPPQG